MEYSLVSDEISAERYFKIPHFGSERDNFKYFLLIYLFIYLVHFSFYYFFIIIFVFYIYFILLLVILFILFGLLFVFGPSLSTCLKFIGPWCLFVQDLSKPAAGAFSSNCPKGKLHHFFLQNPKRCQL